MNKPADRRKQRVRDDFARAADSYDAAAVLQHEVCDRTLERVDMIKLQPRVVLDIGTATGRGLQGLARRFPDSEMVACDLAWSMLSWCRRHQEARMTQALACCDAEQLPFAGESVDLVFSSSTFQWCEDLPRVFSECMRVLRTDGVLIFSTFGPDTLHQLRESFATLDDWPHVHDFIDMHYIGDMLLAQNFTDPVVDMEVIDIQYQSLPQLLDDLKNTGSRGKFSPPRPTASGLMGKQKYRALVQAYEEYRQENGTLPASYEVIYGYARKAHSPAFTADDNREVHVPVSHLQNRTDKSG